MKGARPDWARYGFIHLFRPAAARYDRICVMCQSPESFCMKYDPCGTGTCPGSWAYCGWPRTPGGRKAEP